MYVCSLLQCTCCNLYQTHIPYNVHKVLKIKWSFYSKLMKSNLNKNSINEHFCTKFCSHFSCHMSIKRSHYHYYLNFTTVISPFWIVLCKISIKSSFIQTSFGMKTLNHTKIFYCFYWSHWNFVHFWEFYCCKISNEYEWLWCNKKLC